MMQLVSSAAALLGAVGLLLASGLFARSLFFGATPLVARFAQAEDPSTAGQPAVQRYLRGLTAFWSLTLLACALLVGQRAWADATAFGAAWLLPPTLVALLFFGERWLRSLVFGPQTLGPVRRQWQIAGRVMRGELVLRFRRALRLPEPVFDRAEPARPVIVWRDGEVSATSLQAAAVELAGTLPEGRRLMVVCDDRAVFLWVVLAAWAARRTVVMPPADLKPVIDDAQSGGRQFDAIVTDRPDVLTTDAVPRLQLDGAALRAALNAPHTRTPAIALPADHAAAVFFTSGSTGLPAAQAKTWRQLVDAADAMDDLLQARHAAALLGATVVHSHMFGFEMLVMQALRGACSLYAHRIVFPSDLETFARFQGHNKWLVTTPYHLGVFAEADRLPAGIGRVVSATMPLDISLAARVERASGAEVHEIYGSTEAGCIATRRATVNPVWRLATDLRLTVEDDGSAVLYGARLRGALVLRDKMARVEGGFELGCRDTDLVKVAGKRTSLQALTAVLRGIDGVQDGVFVDGTMLGRKRLAALVVAPDLSNEQLREALALRIDPAFLPRPLVRVSALPRDANGKLRHDSLLGSVATALPSVGRFAGALRANAG
jgi:acyl-coenzyme A synthetase/AMP-(fatty) acid ligase